jgi:hypothetical protein
VRPETEAKLRAAQQLIAEAILSEGADAPAAPIAAPEAAAPAPVPPPPAASTSARALCWGAHVSQVFKDRVVWITDDLGFDPNDLMACMAWETGRKFSASVANMAGSGAVGLIQFMPNTAATMGTTVGKLAAMTAEDQLNWVYRYLKPWKGKIKNLADLYLTILWPKGVGKPDDYVVFDGRQGGVAYRQNAGFDTNGDKVVTKAEASAKLYAIRAEGMKPGNLG